MRARGWLSGIVSRHRTSFLLGLTALTVTSLISLLAGAVLGYMSDTLEMLPGLMVLIPAAIGMRGNIFGAVGSRLGTSLHAGTFELSMRKGSILRENLESSLLLTIFMSFIMGILAKFVSEIMGIDSIPLSGFVFISVIGGVLAGMFLIVFNIVTAIVGFKKNWDIDNISAPIVCTAGDIITLPMLYIASIIVMRLQEMSMGRVIDLTALLFLVVTLGLAVLVGRMRRTPTRRIVVESFPIFILTILLNIGTGVTVDQRLEGLIALPALLVLLPPFLQQTNALSGILTSRLASMLHIGLLEPRRTPGKEAMENFGMVLIFSAWAFALVGIAAHFVAVLLGFGSPGLGYMVLVSLTAGLLASLVLSLLSYYVAVLTFRFSLDPDNVSIPLTSSAMDLIGATFLMGVLMLFGIA